MVFCAEMSLASMRWMAGMQRTLDRSSSARLGSAIAVLSELAIETWMHAESRCRRAISSQLEWSRSSFAVASPNMHTSVLTHQHCSMNQFWPRLKKSRSGVLLPPLSASSPGAVRRSCIMHVVQLCDDLCKTELRQGLPSTLRQHRLDCGNVSFPRIA